jgi:hypothetical protein
MAYFYPRHFAPGRPAARGRKRFPWPRSCEPRIGTSNWWSTRGPPPGHPPGRGESPASLRPVSPPSSRWSSASLASVFLGKSPRTKQRVRQGRRRRHGQGGVPAGADDERAALHGMPSPMFLLAREARPVPGAAGPRGRVGRRGPCGTSSRRGAWPVPRSPGAARHRRMPPRRTPTVRAGLRRAPDLQSKCAD